MTLLVRWFGRLASLTAVVLVALLWYHLPPQLTSLPPSSLLKLVLLVVALAGLLLGWRRELLGGTVATVGLAGFLAVESVIQHRIVVAPALYAMFLPGLFYLLAAARSRQGCAIE